MLKCFNVEMFYDEMFNDDMFNNEMYWYRNTLNFDVEMFRYWNGSQSSSGSGDDEKSILCNIAYIVL